MDKVVSSPADAVADIVDGSSVAVAGFGVGHRFPSSLLVALHELGSKGLTLYCNGLGQPGHATAHLLADGHQIAHLGACFSARPGVVSEAEKQIASGMMTLEMIPQGILVERMRAGAAGMPAFYSPVGLGSEVAEGKDVRYFDGKPYVLETAIRPDFTLMRAHKADRMGNVSFRGSSINFNVSFAKAARCAIVEVDEIVEIGELGPAEVDLPGVFVDRVVRSTVQMDVHNLPRRANRAADSAREYLGKPALQRTQIARRAAALLPDGAVVNLGAGMPNMVSNYINDRPVILHGENGILGYGSIIEGEDFDPDVHDSSGHFVNLRDGASFFDSVTSFELARSGRLDTVILGAYQVAANGDLANWSAPGMIGGGIGGAMDLAAGARSVMVMIEHADRKGNPKLVQRCDMPLTAPHCVQTVVTDLALLTRSEDGFRLEEIADGFTVDEVLSLTGMHVEVADNVGIMQQNW
jgi:3-oxoacid CoA-transferase